MVYTFTDNRTDDSYHNLKCRLLLPSSAVNSNYKLKLTLTFQNVDCNLSSFSLLFSIIIPRRWRQNVSSKLWYPPTSQHGVTDHSTVAPYFSQSLNREDGGRTFLRNFGFHRQVNTASQTTVLLLLIFLNHYSAKMEAERFFETLVSTDKSTRRHRPQYCCLYVYLKPGCLAPKSRFH